MVSSDPHALVPLQTVLAENHIKPLDYLRLYLEDRVPPVILFDDDLYVTQSDRHLWKQRLRGASFDHKAKLLEQARGCHHGRR